MSEYSPRLALPLLQTAQAQKEVTHNAAIAALDMLVHAVVEDTPQATPPTNPVDGTAYLVGAAATGDWAGQDDALALRINGAWHFQAPFDGLSVWLKFFAKTISYSAGAWRIGEVNASVFKIDGVQVISGQQAAIADASGGSTVDAEARTAITAILTALQAHGLIAT
ncbi:MAG: DUF2793 domain-containing protein [Pseudomonadota bacterium]